MFKKLGYMLCGAFIAGMVASGYAVIGTPPLSGFQLVDGDWLNGITAGHNNIAKTGLAAGTAAQAGATQLTPQIRMYEIDTNATINGSVALPPAVASGIFLNIFNNTSSLMQVFPSIVNNSVTAAQDAINGGVSTVVSPEYAIQCFAVQAGRWACR